MRIRDLEIGVRYATCDGALVVPVDLDKTWISTYVSTEKNPGYKVVKIDIPRVDPWGGCNPGGQSLPRGIRPSDVGIRCKQYRPDRDGEIVDRTDFTIVTVNPKDIKGLWDEYMVLHGEIVRTAADRHSWELKHRDMAAKYSAAANGLTRFGGVSVYTYVRESYRTGVNPVIDEISEVQLRFTAQNKQQLAGLLDLLDQLDIVPERGREMVEYMLDKKES